MKHIGISVVDHGSAIVSVERSDQDELLATAIERLPFELDPVAERVRELDAEHPEAQFVIDGVGLGSALWTAAQGPAKTPRWQLYAGRGVERQQLVDQLLVAIHQRRFHFVAGLAEQEAMTKALLTYRREVRDDGDIGSELVVALLLALVPPKHLPNFAWA
jgi:hypothetical protein